MKGKFKEPWGVWHSVPSGMSADIHDCEENHIGTMKSNNIADRVESCVNALDDIENPEAFVGAVGKLIEVAKRANKAIKADECACDESYGFTCGKHKLERDLDSALADIEKARR